MNRALAHDGHSGHPNFELQRHDVTAPFVAEVDLIYHLACPASPVAYQSKCVQALQVDAKEMTLLSAVKTLTTLPLVLNFFLWSPSSPISEKNCLLPASH